MSADYYLYTAYYDEQTKKYIRIDPYFLNKEGKPEQSELVCSDSRHYFGETWKKLQSLADFTYSEEDKGIKGLNLRDFIEDCQDYDTSLFLVSFDTLREYTPETNQFEYIGFKLRTSKDVDYEDEDLIICPEEYSQLDSNAKMCYEYFEYDSYTSWQYHFKYILERLRYIFSGLENVNEYDTYKIENIYLVGLGGW